MMQQATSLMQQTANFVLYTSFGIDGQVDFVNAVQQQQAQLQHFGMAPNQQQQVVPPAPTPGAVKQNNGLSEDEYRKAVNHTPVHITYDVDEEEEVGSKGPSNDAVPPVSKPPPSAVKPPPVHAKPSPSVGKIPTPAVIPSPAGATLPPSGLRASAAAATKQVLDDDDEESSIDSQVSTKAYRPLKTTGLDDDDSGYVVTEGGDTQAETQKEDTQAETQKEEAADYVSPRADTAKQFAHFKKQLRFSSEAALKPLGNGSLNATSASLSKVDAMPPSSIDDSPTTSQQDLDEQVGNDIYEDARTGNTPPTKGTEGSTPAAKETSATKDIQDLSMESGKVPYRDSHAPADEEAPCPSSQSGTKKARSSFVFNTPFKWISRRLFGESDDSSDDDSGEDMTIYGHRLPQYVPPFEVDDALNDQEVKVTDRAVPHKGSDIVPVASSHADSLDAVEIVEDAKSEKTDTCSTEYFNSIMPTRGINLGKTHRKIRIKELEEQFASGDLGRILTSNFLNQDKPTVEKLMEWYEKPGNGNLQQMNDDIDRLVQEFNDGKIEVSNYLVSEEEIGDLVARLERSRFNDTPRGRTLQLQFLKGGITVETLVKQHSRNRVELNKFKSDITAACNLFDVDQIQSIVNTSEPFKRMLFSEAKEGIESVKDLAEEYGLAQVKKNAAAIQKAIVLVQHRFDGSEWSNRLKAKFFVDGIQDVNALIGKYLDNFSNKGLSRLQLDIAIAIDEMNAENKSNVSDKPSPVKAFASAVISTVASPIQAVVGIVSPKSEGDRKPAAKVGTPFAFDLSENGETYSFEAPSVSNPIDLKSPPKAASGAQLPPPVMRKAKKQSSDPSLLKAAANEMLRTTGMDTNGVDNLVPFFIQKKSEGEGGVTNTGSLPAEVAFGPVIVGMHNGKALSLADFSKGQVVYAHGKLEAEVSGTSGNCVNLKKRNKGDPKIPTKLLPSKLSLVKIVDENLPN
jgi:hypothetical protein